MVSAQVFFPGEESSRKGFKQRSRSLVAVSPEPCPIVLAECRNDSRAGTGLCAGTFPRRTALGGSVSCRYSADLRFDSNRTKLASPAVFLQPEQCGAFIGGAQCLRGILAFLAGKLRLFCPGRRRWRKSLMQLRKRNTIPLQLLMGQRTVTILSVRWRILTTLCRCRVTIFRASWPIVSALIRRMKTSCRQLSL